MADVEEFSMDDLLYASQSGAGDRKEEEVEEDESSSFEGLRIMAGDRYSGAEGESTHVWLWASDTNSILFIWAHCLSHRG